MQRILALIYPSFQKEPIVISLPKTKSSLREYLGDHMIHLPLFGNYHLYIGRKNARKKHGSILIAKKRNGNIASLNFSDIEYIKDREKEIRKVVRQLNLNEEKRTLFRRGFDEQDKSVDLSIRFR